MSNWRLTTPATGGQQLSYMLEGAVTIGRDPKNSIRLSGNGVSRFHAVLEPYGDGYAVRDLDSTNGTFVNRVPIRQPTLLRAGDVIRVGNYQLTLAIDDLSQPQTSTFVQPPAGADFPEKAPPPVYSQPLPPPKKKRNFWRTCLIILLVAFCGLVVLGAGGYYFYTTGAISRRAVLNTLGMGSGEIAVTNIADGALSVTLTRLDTDTGSPEVFNSTRLEPLDIGGLGGIPPGRYLLEVRDAHQANCTLQIESGDQFNLVAVPEGIAITKVGFQPSSADELDLATTSLCRQ